MNPARTQTRSSLAVLVVDDQPFAREAISRMAEAFGHRVTSVEGGHAALDQVGDQAFDVAVIDRRMPDMDGVALAVALRALPKTPRLVALSGDDPADMLPGLFDVVLQKPVDARALAVALAGAPVRPGETTAGGGVTGVGLGHGARLASVFLRRKQG